MSNHKAGMLSFNVIQMTERQRVFDAIRELLTSVPTAAGPPKKLSAAWHVSRLLLAMIAPLIALVLPYVAEAKPLTPPWRPPTDVVADRNNNKGQVRAPSTIFIIRLFFLEYLIPQLH